MAPLRFFHAKIPSFSCSGIDLTSSSITRGRLVSLKSLTGSPAYPGQACSRTLMQPPLHAFVSWDQILKGLGRFLMHAAAGILRTTEVWACENTLLVPYVRECCAMDVAEVGQTRSNVSSMVAHPLWPFLPSQGRGKQVPAGCLQQHREALESLCSVGSEKAHARFSSFPHCSTVEQWSHLCWVWIWRGSGGTELLWLPDPAAEDVDSCSQAHKSGWVCCSPLRPCCHVCCIYIMLDFISYFGWLKCC